MMHAIYNSDRILQCRQYNSTMAIGGEAKTGMLEKAREIHIKSHGGQKNCVPCSPHFCSFFRRPFSFYIYSTSHSHYE